VHQLVAEGGSCPWVLWKEEQPYVFFPNNLDGKTHLVINLRQIYAFFFAFLFLRPLRLSSDD
jgi:hypothetical protein